MHAQGLLHTLLDDSCKKLDKRLRRTLFEAAHTLAHCKHLSVVALGRHLPREIKVKHSIKCMDRLFGNHALHQHAVDVYRGIARQVLVDNKRPIILIDWSGLTPCGAFHFLRASIAVNGRSLTLYDQAYPLREYNTKRTHQDFLKTIQSLLSTDCKPIIITDAGFKNTWFQAVSSMGWDFIGRVRSNTHYCLANESVWKPIKTLYQQATFSPICIGNVQLAQSRPISCRFYLVKQNKKYRVKKNLIGRKVRCSSSLKHEQRENEPWLIATSLSSIQPIEVMTLYKKRMQIEESFRDLKNTRNGLGLRFCRSFRVTRLNVALLIAALAMLVLWLFGIAAKQKQLHYAFQTNTEKRSNVLSTIFIGWQLLKNHRTHITTHDLKAALQLMAEAMIWRAVS